MILGRLIRKWRVMSEISLRQLGTMIGISHSTLKRFEDGEPIDGTNLSLIIRWALGSQPFSESALREPNPPTEECA